MTSRVQCVGDLERLYKNNKLAACLFVGNRHEGSAQMIEVVAALADEFKQAHIEFCEVSSLATCRKDLDIHAIPQLWLFKDGQRHAVVRGVDAPKYFAATQEVFAENTSKGEDIETLLKAARVTLRNTLLEQVNEKLVTVVGNPQQNDVRSALEQLSALGLSSAHLMHTENDLEMAEAYVAFCGESNVKLPAVIVDGKPVPLAQFVENLKDSAKLEEIKSLCAKSTERLDARIKSLITKSKVMLFMKGTKASPFCKFSREMVRLLNEAEIDFDFFNIFEDQLVRERLKVIADWPTYPQLYINGDLIGGLDILKETIESAGGIQNLKSALNL